MKMFNLNRKSNIVCRLIAGLLIASIMVCAFPSIEAEADYGSSTASVEITEYGQQAVVVVTADEDGKAVVEYSLPVGCISTGASKDGLTVDYGLTNSGGYKVTISNIPRGAQKTVLLEFAGNINNDEYASITINVQGRKRIDEIHITAVDFTFGDSGTSTYNASEWVGVSTTSGRNASVTLKKDNASFDETAKPIAPGTYSVTASVAEDSNYEAISDTATFVVSKFTPTLSIPDVGPGETPHPSCTFATTGGNITTVDSFTGGGLSLTQPDIAYKGANDAEYSFVVPTEPGTYSAQLVYNSDSRLGDYNNDASTTFKISLKEGKGKVTVADTVYGESSVKPKAESDTNDADKAEFFYKVKNTEDSTYTKELPKKPGKYVCKAVFPKTGSYDECTATCEFVIEKAKGVGTLTASDVYVGMEPKASPVSATNGVTAVTYQYKEKGAADSNYSDKLPTKPGEYTVKATFAATDYYLETSATANFKTSYMPAPTFGLSGKQGKNNFYTDTVTIKAPSGYEVSLSYGKDYKDSINILDGVKYVYFKDKSTGALSDKAAVPSYKMDSVLPVVKGVKNNDTIFKDEYELEVTDDYLEMVKVNDQTIPVKDGKATYKLTSDSGEMLYKIEATDQAGHTVSYTITVASPWVKDGFVPAGQIVKLKPGKAYSLKGGKKYKIKGDDTVYNGGTQFYVDEERELELEEYNEN